MLTCSYRHAVTTFDTAYTPECRTEQPTCTSGAACQIGRGQETIEILYFPPQANISRDMCATSPVDPGFTGIPPANSRKIALSPLYYGADYFSLDDNHDQPIRRSSGQSCTIFGQCLHLLQICWGYMRLERYSTPPPVKNTVIRY